jgi:hypothetical protein
MRKSREEFSRNVENTVFFLVVGAELCLSKTLRLGGLKMSLRFKKLPIPRNMINEKAQIQAQAWHMHTQKFRRSQGTCTDIGKGTGAGAKIDHRYRREHYTHYRLHRHRYRRMQGTYTPHSQALIQV